VAAKLIADLPGEHRVLSTYVSGPPVSEGSRGRIRTFVDSRTPLFFHDADLAVAEEIWSGAANLEVVDARWQFDAAVVEREMPICALLAKDPKWTAVLIEPTFATFVRASAGVPALKVLQPCGFHPIEEESCKRPELDADLARLESFVSTEFMRVLRAERTITCSKQFDGDAVLRSLPTRREASGFLAQRDAVEAWLMALGGRGDAAVDLLEPHVARGDVWVLGDVLPALQKRPVARVRRLLEGLDDTSPAGRASFGVLANVCASLEDVACARANAGRAAVAGRTEELPALCWLSRQPDARAREDATRWLAALSLRCP
jgi:hypothetical protein